ncbi:HIT-like protein, partial [Conidiobolus coronatus NRRL 28638]
DCVFCNSAFEGKVEYEDSQISIIEDRSPASDTLHLLIIPKEHIQNCNNLTKEHLPLLNLMKAKSEEFIRSKGEFGEHETIVGFHQSPFIMVNHLHLHVIILPMKSWFHYILFN